MVLFSCRKYLEKFEGSMYYPLHYGDMDSESHMSKNIPYNLGLVSGIT